MLILQLGLYLFRAISWLVTATIIICYLASPASADVILDRSPDTINSSILIENFLNVDGKQWYAERFELTQETLVDGIDIYSNSYGRNLIGTDVLIRIWSDQGNQPGALLLKSYSSISIVNNDGTLSVPTLTRKYSAISSEFTAKVDTQYWISMTGLSDYDNIGLASYVNIDDGSMWIGGLGNADTFRGDCDFCGDMIFRLHGTPVTPVPEPATTVLFGIGIAGLAAIGRSKRN